MNAIAQNLWEQSDAYINIAKLRLNPRLLRPQQLVGNHDENEWLRISFLFPTLPEKSKTDLLVVRRFFLLAREQQQRIHTHPQESAEYSEAMADRVAAQLKEALPSFSPVQQELLTTHYLILGENAAVQPDVRPR